MRPFFFLVPRAKFSAFIHTAASKLANFRALHRGETVYAIRIGLGLDGIEVPGQILLLACLRGAGPDWTDLAIN